MAGFYPMHGKRIFDLILVVLSAIPLLAMAACITLLYLVTAHYPVFFFSERTGLHESTFKMIKFRTLKQDLNLSLSERSFWLGSMLRLTNLDELPQVWNILKGQMSWVGPRPLPVEYNEMLSTVEKKRYGVRPGITGWAQVNGKNELAWPKKFELDLEYVERLSFGLDVRIIFRTVILLLRFKRDISLTESKLSK
ncbi:MAG: sugar transferase [Cyclobacteriaceae bacterium]|nr:sugar transferase [Cyclobacteriaceae bacterium]